MLVFSDITFRLPVDVCELEIHGLEFFDIENCGQFIELREAAGNRLVISVKHDRFESLDTVVRIPADSYVVIVLPLRARVDDQGQPDPLPGPYKEGWVAAGTDLDGDNACYYTAGGFRLDFLDVDEETGLPIRGNPTCISTPELQHFASGYNDRVGFYIRQHGWPRNSLLPWIENIVSPKVYFDSVEESGGAINLMVDSRAVTCPHGRVAIGVSRKPDSTVRLEIWVRDILTGTLVKRPFCLEDIRKKIKLVWGPPSSGLIFVKTSKWLEVYGTKHLERLNLVW